MQPKRLSVAVLTTFIPALNMAGVTHWYMGARTMAAAKLGFLLLLAGAYYYVFSRPTLPESYQVLGLIACAGIVIIWYVVDFMSLYLIAFFGLQRVPYGMGDAVWIDQSVSLDRAITRVGVLLFFFIFVLSMVYYYVDTYIPGSCIKRKDYASLDDLFKEFPIEKYIQDEDATFIGNLVILLKNNNILKYHPTYSGQKSAHYTRLFCNLPDEVKQITPNISQLGYASDMFYTIQSLAPGNTVANMLKDGMKADTSTKVVRSMCRIAAILAKHQVVHNDLHLRQFFYDGSNGEATIIDFDVARIKKIYESSSFYLNTFSCYQFASIYEMVFNPNYNVKESNIGVQALIRSLGETKFQKYMDFASKSPLMTADSAAMIPLLFAFTHDESILNPDLWSSFEKTQETLENYSKTLNGLAVAKPKPA